VLDNKPTFELRLIELLAENTVAPWLGKHRTYPSNPNIFPYSPNHLVNSMGHRVSVTLHDATHSVLLLCRVIILHISHNHSSCTVHRHEITLVLIVSAVTICVAGAERRVNRLDINDSTVAAKHSVLLLPTALFPPRPRRSRGSKGVPQGSAEVVYHLAPISRLIPPRCSWG
jgi:hypothetical protein